MGKAARDTKMLAALTVGRLRQAGLRPKDVVVGVNRKPVKSVDELSKELKDSKRQTALFLKRGGEDMLVVIQ